MSELKSKHAFGAEANVDSAISQGLIDAYDIIFLNEGKIGWLDKNGNKIMLRAQIVRVDELPTADGDEDVVYIYNNEGYVWDAVNAQCIPLAKSSDLTALETQVSTLETQMSDKVDASDVQTMVDTKVEEAVSEAIATEVVEF